MCDITLHVNRDKLNIRGEVSSFEKFPLRIDFEEPIESEEINLFNKSLEESSDNIQLKCELSSKWGGFSKKLSLYINDAAETKVSYNEKLTMEKIDERVSKMINLTETKFNQEIKSSIENLTRITDSKSVSLENRNTELLKTIGYLESKLNDKIESLISNLKQSIASGKNGENRNLANKSE